MTNATVSDAVRGADLVSLETPVPIVDLDRLEANLERMATYAASHGLALRPHVKTHKTPWIGARTGGPGFGRTNLRHPARSGGDERGCR
jgi:hypothetical protein